MFSNDKNIETVSELLRDAYDYTELRLKQLRLDFVSKLSALFSALLLSVVLMVIVAVVLLFLAYTVALVLAPHVGGLHVACALIALFLALVGVVLYVFRQPLIVRPLTGFVAELFLGNGEADDAAAAGTASADDAASNKEGGSL